MRRSWILVTISALVVALAPATSVAHAVQPLADLTFTADFESSGTVSPGDVITTQYPFVTFDAFNAAGYGFAFGAPANGVIAVASSNPTVVAADAHTGSNAGEVVCGVEFCRAGTFGVLNDTTDALSLYAGNNAVASAGLELDAYDSDGNYIAHDIETSSAIGAHTLLSVTAPAGKSIAYFTVYLQAGDALNLEIDDLTASVPAGSAPAVGVSASASSYEIGQDGTISIPLSIQRINGATGAVTLTLGGFTAHLTGSPSDPGTGNTSTLTVTASHNAPLGDLPVTITASATDAQSHPALHLTITVISPMSFAAVTHVVSQTCEPNTISVEAQIAPGEPGTAVSFATSFSPPEAGLSATVTSPITISNGLADTTVHLSNTGGTVGTSLHVTATLSNGDTAIAGINVTRLGPSITAIDAIGSTRALTPRAGQPGTALEVYGHGFCNTATVYVGNDKAPVTGTVQHLTNGQGPYDYIRVNTPRLATTGPITVAAGSPSDTGQPSAASMTVDSYRNVDAWNFQNFDPQLTFDDLTQAYGSDQTYLHVDPCGFFTFGLGHCSVDIVPDPTAVLLLGIAQASMQDGTCFGMALTTQRILQNEVELSTLPGNPTTIYDVPKPDTSTAAQQTHGTSQVLDLLKSVHLMQLSTQFMEQWLSSVTALNITPQDQVSDDLAGEISNIFAKGRDPLVEIQDSGGHVVVAYDIAQTGPSAYDIYVYDSNDQFTPDEVGADGTTHASHLNSSVIHLAADGSWSLASTTQSDHAPWHGGIGNLVVTDPNTVPLHPTLPSFSGAAPPGALFSSLGGPGTSSGSRASSARITQVSSGGRTLFTPTGSINTNPTTRLDAAPFGPFVSLKTKPASKLTQLIAIGGGAHDLVVSTKGKSSGSDAMTFVQGSYAGEVTASTASGAKQTESFASHSGSVGFSGTSTNPVTLDVNRSTSNSQHSVAVTLAHPGTTDHLTLGSGTGAVTLTHSGPATTFTLTLSGAQSQGLPETFTSGPIHLGAGQSAHLTSAKWGGLGAGTMKLKVGGHTVKLRNLTHKLAGAAITSLHVSASHKHPRKITFRVKGKLSKLTAGSQAFVIWLVRRGHHLIATHHASILVTKRAVNAKWTKKLAKRSGLTFTAVIVTIRMRGTTEEAAKSSRSTTFAVG